MIFKGLFKQDCIPVGCIPSARWPYLPACSALGVPGAVGGCLVQGGACLVLGGCLPGPGGGVPAWSRGGLPGPGGRWYPSMYWGSPPPVDRILDTRFRKYYLATNFVCGPVKTNWWVRCAAFHSQARSWGIGLFYEFNFFPSNDHRLSLFVTAWIERNDYIFVLKIFFIILDPIQNIYVTNLCKSSAIGPISTSIWQKEITKFTKNSNAEMLKYHP